MKTVHELKRYTVIEYDNNGWHITDKSDGNEYYFMPVDTVTIYFAFKGMYENHYQDKAAHFRVTPDHEFTYNVMKTKIKAIDGCYGLYKHFVDCINHDFAIESWVLKPMKQALFHCKPVKVNA